MADDGAHLCRLLEDLVRQKKYTRREIAAIAGIDPSNLTIWLRDKRANPSLSTLLRLSRGLGIPLSHLVGAEENEDDRSDLEVIQALEMALHHFKGRAQRKPD